MHDHRGKTCVTTDYLDSLQAQPSPAAKLSLDTSLATARKRRD